MKKIYVDWEYEPVTYMTLEQFNVKLQEWKKKGITKVTPDLGLSISSLQKGFKHWFEFKDYICCFEEEENIKIKIVNDIEDTKINPYDCFVMFKDKAKEINKISFGYQFGRVPKNFWILRNCVPRQISWCTQKKELKFKALNNCYKADVSSAFGYEATKSLPTWIGHRIVEGIATPTADYPFAFVSTGRTIIYGELDTEDFYNTPFYYEKIKLDNENRLLAERFGYPIVNLKKELGRETKEKVFTILCKKSKYNLYNVFDYYYREKEGGNKFAKNIMNIFIGMCWLKKQPLYLHLAAVIIARCNKRMIDTAYKLAEMGDIPILIATDSVAWIGRERNDLTSSRRYLGAFVTELNNGEMIIGGSKCYQVRKGNKEQTIWAGMPKEKSEKLPFGYLSEETALDYEFKIVNDKIYIVGSRNGIIVKEEEYDIG